MNSDTDAAAQYQSTVNNIMQLLKQRRVDDAVIAARAFMDSNPESNDALLLLAKARQMQGRFEDTLKLVEIALRRAPDNIGLHIQFIGACQFCGHHDRALAQLAQIEPAAQNDGALLQNIANLYVGSGKYEDAHRCYLRAVKLASNNSQYLKNLAASFVAIGDLRKAEETYSKLIKRTPHDYEAWYNRSTLRKQSANNNHIQKLEKALHGLSPMDPGKTPLCYALSKEYEDLGKDERSFSYLKSGADNYRRGMKYDVQLDVSLMRRIAELFDHTYAENSSSAAVHDGPVFVLGLPRSGTTLVDRIISSHSKVESLGEINDLAMTLNRVGQSTDREQLLENCARVDPEQFGRSYRQSVASYGSQAPHFVDKTPTNFLYIGLIAKALPGASIIHLRRHPVDSCLSMYRTMFRLGYPFSYDLADLAEYYIAYDALMQHWRTTFPCVVFDVSYEELVDNQERVSKDIVSRCGLDWEPACLEFALNTAPVSTASAAQVRKPMYRDALARWRRFETQLEPLIERLRKAGIAL